MGNKLLVLVSLFLPLMMGAAPQAVQIPAAVKTQVAELQDRFSSVLDEECPHGTCYSGGCKVSRFDTLDQTQDSSLPGLEDAPTAEKAQFKLGSVLCEFTYEPSLTAEDLTRIRQRVKQKVQTVGTDVQLTARALEPRAIDPNVKAPPPPPPPEAPLTWDQALWQRLLPFVPWFFAAFVLTGVSLALIWGLRRLGRTKAEISATGALVPLGAKSSDMASPTPRMLITRVEQLREELKSDKRLVELALKRHFEEENFDELCAFLRHFGPELLGAFKEKAEYRDALGTLSLRYGDKVVHDDAVTTWAFLDRLDRDMTAAKVRIDAEPLADDFNFLATLEIDEFVGILRELPEDEAIAAVSYAPRRLRERFFGHANAAFTAKFVEHLTKVEKMPDAFVRRVAAKLRRIYAEKGTSLRTIRVDRIPLLEEALNALEPTKRKALFLTLGKDNPGFAQSVTPAVFLDDSLPLLPDGLLTEALLTVSPEEAGRYLAAFAWGPELLAKVNPRLTEAIKPHMLGNDSETAEKLARSGREKIGAFVKRMHANGTINLSQLNAKLVEGLQ